MLIESYDNPSGTAGDRGIGLGRPGRLLWTIPGRSPGVFVPVVVQAFAGNGTTRPPAAETRCKVSPEDVSVGHGKLENLQMGFSVAG